MITQQKNYVKHGKNTSTENADTLIREYKQKRWVQNSERIGKPDSLSSWYSIEEIEKLLIAAKSNGGDGIKIYFGAYPENYIPKPAFAGRQTVVMVATKSKKTKAGDTANKDIYISRNGILAILGLDPQHICPPMCITNLEGGMGDLGITLVDKGDKGMEVI